MSPCRSPRGRGGSRAAPRGTSGRVDAHEATHDPPDPLAHEHAPGEREIAIEPRVEERAAVHLDAELRVALLRVLGVRLEPEVRAVGVRADDAEAAQRRARPGSTNARTLVPPWTTT